MQEFWDNNSSQSTLTFRPAKLKVSDKNKIQIHLDFVDSVKIVQNKRKFNFYESQWVILNCNYHALFMKYISIHQSPVSKGTSMALKPFYIRSPPTNDIEVCCCKLHLHARWSIKALIGCTEKQQIALDFHDYKIFFEFLTRDCPSVEDTYIHWDCTRDKNSL